MAIILDDDDTTQLYRTCLRLMQMKQSGQICEFIGMAILAQIILMAASDDAEGLYDLIRRRQALDELLFRVKVLKEPRKRE